MKNRGRNKRFSHRQPNNKRKRKQFSLYAGKQKGDRDGFKPNGVKRKYDNDRVDKEEFKRPKIEHQREESSESEPEFEDHLKKLRESLQSGTKHSQAIDSSDDSMSEDEDSTENHGDDRLCDENSSGEENSLGEDSLGDEDSLDEEDSLGENSLDEENALGEEASTGDDNTSEEGNSSGEENLSRDENLIDEKILDSDEDIENQRTNSDKKGTKLNSFKNKDKKQNANKKLNVSDTSKLAKKSNMDKQLNTDKKLSADKKIKTDERNKSSRDILNAEDKKSSQVEGDEGSEEEEEVAGDDQESDAEVQKEENNPNTTHDPFSNHIQYELSESLLTSVQAKPVMADKTLEKWPQLGSLSIQIPKCEPQQIKTNGFSIENEKKFAPRGEIPKRISISKDSFESLFIKTQIVNNIRLANARIVNEELPEEPKLPFTELQAELFAIMNNYQDLMYPQRTFENAEELRFAYCLHAINHVLKTRTKVLHHNARLADKDDVPEEFRDQGLVRPKVLIIVPFRDSCHKIVTLISNILFSEDKGNVMNKKRFTDDFTGNEITLPKKNPKPEDYEKIFTGNSGDDFKIGITVTKKSLKLYADFYSSDIIIASPLGLRTIIGAPGEPERDFDFLASVEILILDQTEIFLMQNFHHVLHIFDHLHVQPKESHGTDFSRVRHWCLNGWAKYYRQTLIFSSMVIPEANSIFSDYCFNYSGKISIVNPIKNGLIRQVHLQLPHVYQKFHVKSLQEAIESRFNFFVNMILPEHKDPLMKQTLIFVPNYYDFVKLRNYFKREDVSFVQICEYSKEAKVARARDMFFHGDAHFLLYTERYHFFNRIRLKGIRHIIFYQLPAFGHFYTELCNLMTEGNMNKKVGSMLNMTVTVLYSKFDAHQLAAVVSTERAASMLKSESNLHKILTTG